MTHKFNVGQFVSLETNVLRPAAPGPYEIRRLIPAMDNRPGELRYQVKCDAEKHERMVPESELTLVASVWA